MYLQIFGDLEQAYHVYIYAHHHMWVINKIKKKKYVFVFYITVSLYYITTQSQVTVSYDVHISSFETFFAN